MPAKRRAFTTPELLIALALVAILVVAATPRWRQAAVIDDIAQARSDLQALQVAVEAYFVDNADYPGASQFGGSSLRGLWSASVQVGNLGPYGGVTTPIAYIGAIPYDSFNVDPIFPDSGRVYPYSYDKAGFGFQTNQNFPNEAGTWVQIRGNQEAATGALAAGFVVQLPNDHALNGINSNGVVNGASAPRLVELTPRRYVLWSIGPSGQVWRRPGDAATTRYAIDYRYDPTNGLASRGFIMLYEGGGELFPDPVVYTDYGQGFVAR